MLLAFRRLLTLLSLSSFFVVIFASRGALAEDDGGTNEAALPGQMGPAKIEIGHDLSLDLPDKDMFLPPSESARLLEKDGSFHNENLLGIVAPMVPPLVDGVPAVADGVVDALAPWSNGMVPVNFASPQTVAARPGACWSDEQRARLTEVSRRVDPDGVLGGRRLGLR